MKIIFFLVKIIILIGLIAIGFYLWPEKISGQPENTAKISLVKTAFNFLLDRSESLSGEERGRVNILFLGLPGEGNDAPNLTDTIILLSIRPSDNRFALLSLPRDLLVKIPKRRGALTKINALFEISKKNPDLIKEKVAEITSQPIDYYVALDTTAVEKTIDMLGGLNVWVAEDISDPNFPTPGHGTEYFAVEKGWRYFDGKTVQKYLRTRHSPDGDFARMRQQQAIMEALRKKIFGLNLLYDFPTALSIFRTVRADTQTDLDEANLKRLYDIAKNVSYDNVVHKVVDGDPKKQDSLLHGGTIKLGEQEAFVLIPKKGEFDYNDIQTLARNIFDN